MREIQASEAKTHLPQLLDEIERGETIIITRRNLLLANERHQRITPTQTAAALNLVQELPMRFDSQADSDTTLQLARAHRWTVYDAVYLELAVRRHLPLVTFDAALAEAATRIDVSNPKTEKA